MKDKMLVGNKMISLNERGEPVCDTCGMRMGQRIGGRIFCSSNYIGGPTCRSCMLDYCLSTNCLGCKVGEYPYCEHLGQKRFYQEEIAREEGVYAGRGTKRSDEEMQRA